LAMRHPFFDLFAGGHSIPRIGEWMQGNSLI
jgi:hypothetical protein